MSFGSSNIHDSSSSIYILVRSALNKYTTKVEYFSLNVENFCVNNLPSIDLNVAGCYHGPR